MSDTIPPTAAAHAAAYPSPTTMRTLSGAYIDFLDPKPEQIVLGDIIRGVSRQPRYVGHTLTDDSWTVGDHLVLCVALARHIYPKARPDFYAAVFLHDGHEGFMGDLITPLKAAFRALGAEHALKTIETRLDNAIHLSLGIPYPLPAEWPAMIKSIDRLAFQVEESHFRRYSDEQKFLPEGFKLTSLPMPVSSEIERTLRTVNCWNQIMADRIVDLKPTPAPIPQVATRPGVSLG
jgi:5'-deoxynucleotidase YfbR-like HD superfamily hydrolase